MNAIARDPGGDAFFRTNDVNWALKKSFEAITLLCARLLSFDDGQGFRDIACESKDIPVQREDSKRLSRLRSRKERKGGGEVSAAAPV